MTDAGRRELVVVGAGVSGLAAAFVFARAGRAVVVLEQSEAVGGVLDTRRRGEWLVEMGPNTVAAKPALDELVQECGLARKRLPAAAVAGRRYLWRDGALRPLPASPRQLLGSPLLSWRGKLALAREPWVPPRPAGASEESVAAFVRRRLGEEAVAVFAAPFVAGIHAGDPARLSARWVLPRLLESEQQHGSLWRAARAARGRGGPPLRHPLVTFEGGLATLPERLAAVLPELQRATRVEAVRRVDGGFVVESTAGAFSTPRVIVATGAAEAASLTAGATAGVAAPLGELPYSPLAVLALGYRRVDVAHALDGFGFLAAPGSGLRLLGCLFTSSLFADRAPAGHVLLTCFLGGRLTPALVGRDDAELVGIAGEDLARALGVRGEPVLALVRRWGRAIPQYELGHGRYVALAAQVEAQLPGLRFAGNWIDGAGVADCAGRGAAIARALLASG